MIVSGAVGVFKTIKDESQNPTSANIDTGAAIACATPYGEDNVWRLITQGPKELVSKYGNVEPVYGQAYLNAYRFSLSSNNLYIMRVLPNADDEIDGHTVKGAKYAHTILCLAKDANSDERFTILPVYFNESSDTANTLQDSIRHDAPTKFTKQTFVLPNGETTHDNTYSYIETSIQLTDDQKNAIQTDTYLKSQFLDPKNISELDSTLTPFMIIYGIGRGSWYNNLAIRITKIPNTKGLFNLEVISVSDNGIMSLESFDISFDPSIVDASGETYFVEHVVNTYSKYIRVRFNRNLIPRLNAQSPVDSTKTLIEEILYKTYYTTDTYNMSYPLTQTKLMYGSEGDLLQNGLLNTQVYTMCLLNAYNGVYDPKINDREAIDIDLLLDANYDMAVKQALVNLAIRRSDCFVILDETPVANLDQIVNTRNNAFSWLDTYLASGPYTPFTEIKHPQYGTTIKVAPSYHAAYVYPYNDQQGVWKAPAGPNRGVLHECIKTVVDIPTDAKTISTLLNNRINPIVKKNGTYMFYGNETSQRASTDLSQINVVRTLLKLDKELSKYFEQFIYEDNNPDTWLRAEQGAREILSKWQNMGALYWFDIEVGATEYEIKNMMMHAFVFVKVMKTIKVINLVYTVRSGA